LDYYVSFDNVKVGESQAQGVLNVVPKGKIAYVGGSETDSNAFLVKEGSFKVLQPLIDKGDIEIVFNEFSKDWKQDVAYTNMKKFLAGGGQVDAVVAANDSTAAGVILALEEVGLAGKVPVSGQDASLGAVKYIVSGKQTVTVYKPIKDLAFKSAEIAVAVTRDEKVVTNSTIKNGTALTPAYLLDVVGVTKANLDATIIKDGFLSRKEVYGN
jgi:D-xylose transport system substrate-binding protein